MNQRPDATSAPTSPARSHETGAEHGDAGRPERFVSPLNRASPDAANSSCAWRERSIGGGGTRASEEAGPAFAERAITEQKRPRAMNIGHGRDDRHDHCQPDRGVRRAPRPSSFQASCPSTTSTVADCTNIFSLPTRTAPKARPRFRVGAYRRNQQLAGEDYEHHPRCTPVILRSPSQNGVPAKRTNAPQTITLSTTGSTIRPNDVTDWVSRASIPSRMS